MIAMHFRLCVYDTVTVRLRIQTGPLTLLFSDFDTRVDR